MNGSKTFVLVLFFFAAVHALAAQETGPVFRRLTWQPVEYASGYEVAVEILTASNEWVEQFRKTSGTETFIDCPLFTGKYRFRVSAFDLLGRPGSTTEWIYFELRAREPVKAPEPAPAPELAPEPAAPAGPEPPAVLPAAPLPQEDEDSRFTVELFYAPAITLPFSEFNEIYSTDPFQPIGFTGNFTVYPFKNPALGLGLTPFWHFLATEIHLKSRYTHIAGSHLFAAWQIRPAGKPVYIHIRIGGGFTYFSSRFDFNEGLDITEQAAWNPSLNAGLSLQSRLSGPLFFDAGLEYFHIFSEDNLTLNYLKPHIGVGWRF
jgi:hypothetical protein